VSDNLTLAEKNPGGCYLAFNGMLDRKGAEQLVHMCSEARNAGFTAVTLCLSSLGGYLADAYYAFNMLEGLPLRLITHNASTIQSAANMLFLVGDERYACPGSTFFFHQTAFEATSGQRVTEAYAAEKLKAIQLEDVRSAQIIADKTAQTVERVRQWQNSEFLMSTDDAIAHGILHEVRPLAIPKDALFQQIVLQG
jgi:ATP-dependent Clp protease protease subunit